MKSYNGLVVLLFLIFSTFESFVYSADSMTLSSAEEKQVVALADGFAHFLTQGNRGSVCVEALQTAKATPNRLQSLAQENLDEPIIKDLLGERRGWRFRWSAKIKVADFLFTAGFWGLITGFFGQIVMDFLGPDSWQDTINSIGSFTTTYSLRVLAASLVWWAFLPNPEVSVPVGVSWLEDPAINVKVEKIYELFFARLAQNGIKIPTETDREIWLVGLAAGIPREAIENAQILQNEIEVLKRRLERLQTFTFGNESFNSPYQDTLSRVTLALSNAGEFKRGIPYYTSHKKWRANAFKKLSELTLIVNALEENHRVSSTLKQYDKVLRTQDSLSRRFVELALPYLFGLTPIIETLDALHPEDGDSLAFEISNFERVSPANFQANIKAIVRFRLRLRLQKAGRELSHETTVSVQSNYPTLTEVLERESTWVEPIVSNIKAALVELDSAEALDIDSKVMRNDDRRKVQ